MHPRPHYLIEAMIIDLIKTIGEYIVLPMCGTLIIIALLILD